MSNKVPGQAEKWDDVIRQLTSVWTPESAARVLAAIAQLDLHGSSSEGDVLARVGDKFVPHVPPIVAVEVAFTETAGAGTYTGTIALPAGATILDIALTQVAQWTAATSAVMQVGDAGDAAGFISALDLKTAAAGATWTFGSLGGWGGPPAGAYVQQAGSDGSFLGLYSAGARTITGTVATVGGSGTAGRTRLIVSYATAIPTAATKV